MSELPIPTAHINAQKDAFAKTVLMPGDPKRSKHIAEKYLKNAVLVNDVRGVQGYTGEYKGKKVSVMASGMGMPSIGIYSYELYHAYNVQNIIRIGTCGSLLKDIPVKNIVVATGACTDSNYGASFGLKGIISAIPSFELLKKADEISKKLGIQDKTRFGQVISSDLFYSDCPDTLEWTKMGVLAVEMEAYALYLNAARAGKNALCICSVSNNIVTNQELTAEDRTEKLDDMILLALEMAASLD
jgi:purine-nucleoside phosphorylase